MFGGDLDELFVNFFNRQLWGLSTSGLYPALSLRVEVGMYRPAIYGERQHQNELVDSEPRRSNKQLVLLSVVVMTLFLQVPTASRSTADLEQHVLCD